ncbi:MAG: lipid-binding SYLF domain-containing protein [Casimicrobiaceae bacterium]
MNPVSASSTRYAKTAFALVIATGLTACATTSGERMSSSEPDRLVADAQVTLNNFLRDPDQTWVQENLSRAKAVLIAPQIVKAGFIFGGSGGRAVLVAKNGSTWAGPAFYDLATASVGFQAGLEVSEAVIMVMTDKGLNSLMATTFKIGGDASIAAGPVGAGAKSTITADLVSFTRSKGIYGGVNLDGTVVHSNVAWNNAYYNANNVLPPDVLMRKTVKSPKASAFLADVTKATK